ncbi:MAG: L-arabinolactonase (EC [uncultured Caballeronia sp.]|nr:MAG: L-arabinolactonase (EC [uncultured Caballeronia sp.]
MAKPCTTAIRRRARFACATYPRFANDRVFVELTDVTGVPDGSIVDAEGGL